MAGQPKIFIATPTGDGIMLAEHVGSVVRMVAHLTARGIATEYRTLDGCDLVLQRNLLADAFLRSDGTHLLFVDSDMAFGPDLVDRLLAADKPLIGAVYPKRRLDLPTLERLSAERPFADALALTHDWNVQADGPVEVSGGLCRVDALPCGFLLVSRECLDDMAGRTGVPEFRHPGGLGEPVRAFFQEIRDGHAIVDQDYAFCRRWRQADGEVWACVDAALWHLGDWNGTAPFSVRLRAAGAVPAGAPR